MKKSVLILPIVALALVFGSCNKLAEKSSIYKELKADADSLVVETELRSAELDEICKTIDGIVAGLDNIEEEERAVAMISHEVSVDGAAKERASESLKAIVLSVERYKQEVATLEQKLKSQPAQFRATINSLRKRLEEKDAMLVSLSDQLGVKDAAIDSIRTRLNSLEIVNDSLKQELGVMSDEMIAKQEVIEQQESTINAGYYTMGTQSELKKAGVLVKKKVSPKINAKKFTRIDIYKNREIELNTAKKIKLASSHPENSYSIEPNKFGVKILKIKDPNAFWKQSRYLVIVEK